MSQSVHLSQEVEHTHTHTQSNKRLFHLSQTGWLATTTGAESIPRQPIRRGLSSHHSTLKWYYLRRASSLTVTHTHTYIRTYAHTYIHTVVGIPTHKTIGLSIKEYLILWQHYRGQGTCVQWSELPAQLKAVVAEVNQDQAHYSVHSQSWICMYIPQVFISSI